MNCIKEFNKQLESFFVFMIKICPTDTEECANVKKDIVAYKGIVNAAIKLNKLTAIEKYIIYILVHEDKINSRDEEFFISREYDIGSNKEKTLLEVMRFKQIWSKLTERRKEKIFDFMIVLTYWARQYFNTKYINKN